MTSQDYSTNCVSDEPGGDEDHFNQSESETELQSQSVGEPIEKRQIPNATCEVTDQNPSVESPVPSLQTTPPTNSFKETPHTNSDEFYPGKTFYQITFNLDKVMGKTFRVYLVESTLAIRTGVFTAVRRS